MEDIIIQRLDIHFRPLRDLFDVAWDLTDHEVEDIASVHITLFLTTDITVFIDNLFFQCFHTARHTVTAGIDLDQVATGTVRVERKKACPEFFIPFDKCRNSAVAEQKCRPAVFR